MFVAHHTDAQTAPYNPAVRRFTRSTPFNPVSQNLWSRFAAFLSFLAVVSALWAPVSMLAQDVQSGKLGGICSLNNLVASSAGDLAAGSGSAQGKGSHCGLCGAPGLVLPLLALLVIPSFPGMERVALVQPSTMPTRVVGLPFSHGPPFTL